jgi:hypothetical protein
MLEDGSPPAPAPTPSSSPCAAAVAPPPPFHRHRRPLRVHLLQCCQLAACTPPSRTLASFTPLVTSRCRLWASFRWPCPSHLRAPSTDLAALLPDLPLLLNCSPLPLSAPTPGQGLQVIIIIMSFGTPSLMSFDSIGVGSESQALGHHR